MVTNQYFKLVCLFFLLACLAGCKSAPPEIGHYIGTDPDVSFDLTSEGTVSRFTMPLTVKVDNVSVACMAYGARFYVQKDGSFSEIYSSQKINGKVMGNNFSGHFEDSKCVVPSSDGVGLKEVYPDAKIDINWTASYYGESPTSTPIPLPKLGHFTGSNPDVSFDITSMGVENFTISGGTTCTWKVGPLILMSIEKNGSFSNKDSNSRDGVGGTVIGEHATGGVEYWHCSQGSTGVNRVGEAWNEQWIAHWVSP